MPIVKNDTTNRITFSAGDIVKSDADNEITFDGYSIAKSDAANQITFGEVGSDSVSWSFGGQGVGSVQSGTWFSTGVSKTDVADSINGIVVTLESVGPAPLRVTSSATYSAVFDRWDEFLSGRDYGVAPVYVNPLQQGVAVDTGVTYSATDNIISLSESNRNFQTILVRGIIHVATSIRIGDDGFLGGYSTFSGSWQST